ncbi:MAG: FkbM family methyltransferase [Bacteroidales bacterium]|jgi:FkbM family methyltransferase|nr:FkbM family methyltransferase [Bacteroidales bacterium]
MNIKDILREILITFHLDLTKNLKYDRLTRKIMKREIKNHYNCIDIGCHKGEILNIMMKYSPEGKHYGFEPIPNLYLNLENKYKGKATIYPYALSDENGTTTFQFVKNAPAYSGIKQRRYDIENPDIEEIIVEKKKLDDIINPEDKIDFIKIDVEGGEFGVMKGGMKLLKNNKPIILFECGKGASDYYGTNPIDLYNFISNEISLKIFTLNDFIKNKPAMNAAEFENYFNTNKEYYFVAAR